ncbi:type VI secretion system protein ImpB [Pseudoalteromonas ulvae UL12]|uniref:Type VI secretion system-associated protein n=1 Tax=Pseudoalteromonas ulvae TaxID=107327 RepID=A0A244CRH7_PSEDV|nr:type VI secretion system contractile sheath small subunit [Pseudoalteromonas ulvae]MBE0366073.1 type VI secretion system protein ImpB [Pseudoalteromonas ulvae UL12]OUL58204.1 type VI secretion system-associated protein [Pseudoalteromonas ulvae]
MASRSKGVGSVAPKERINISYRPATGAAKEGIELPFKVLVLGDFTQTKDSETTESRKLINVNSHNFDDVMEELNLKVNFSVPNKMISDSDEVIEISLDINKLKDFEPDQIIEQVDELKKILELREALKSLKGPLGNSPQMRRQIQRLLADESSRNELKKEIGLVQ